jgi:hypothetical protein
MARRAKTGLMRPAKDIPASKQNVMRFSSAFEIEQVSADNFC